MTETPRSKQHIKVRYTETSALYASQFILNSSEEDITINFSSGPLADPGSGETILPIHTRIALSIDGAKRLRAVLGKVLDERVTNEKMMESVQAQLPKMKQ